MATKLEKSKAYDAGQAAQLHGVPDEACPFAPDTEEYAEYMRGKSDDLDEKWTSATRAITKDLTN